MVEIKGFHYHSPKVLVEKEGGVYRDPIRLIEDIKKDQVFFVGNSKTNWIPYHLKEYKQGELQEITYRFNKKFEESDLLKYHDYTVFYEETSLTTLSKKGKELQNKGFDALEYVGQDIHEVCLFDPSSQIKEIKTISIPDNSMNFNHNLVPTINPSDNPPWAKKEGFLFNNYEKGFSDRREMLLKLLTIKESKEKQFGTVLGDTIESNIRYRQGALASSGFIFEQEKFILPEDIPAIRDILVNKFGFVQEFVNNSGKNEYKKTNLTYHELLVKYGENHIPVGAAMMMSTEDLTSSYDLAIFYIGDVSLGNNIYEELKPYIHKRKYLPTFRLTRGIRLYPDGAELDFRDEILDNNAELALASFYPTLNESVESFSDRYMKSNAPILLVYGPTGTGKTTLLRTMSKHLNAVFVVTANMDIAKHPEFFESYKDMVKRAKMQGDPRPYILLIEDVDQMLFSRLSGNREMSRILNDTKGIGSNLGIKVIFTTNLTSLDQMDSALLRPGRCFYKLELDKITEEQAHKVRSDLGYQPISLEKFLVDGKISLAEAIEEMVVPNEVKKNPHDKLMISHPIDF